MGLYDDLDLDEPEELPNGCCFTGHRPNKLPWGTDESDPRCLALKAEILARTEGIYLTGIRTFYCGMALGCDSYFFEALLQLRQKYPDLRIEAAVPCDAQSSSWTQEEQERYRRFLSSADQVNYVQHTYTRGCMQKRNRFMVDRSSVVLACFNGTAGGTMGTILYAQREGRTVITIDI